MTHPKKDSNVHTSYRNLGGERERERKNQERDVSQELRE